MHLKSIEVIGFKSFAYKTKINFQNGLTEIVGPNGSGKSNITEAIRWVLGEQSPKNLRSNKMSDIIFAGSDNHQALSRASVTLTFDNNDHVIKDRYSEIKVSRKLFRNGNSFYYLDNQETRLKDINDLFINAGINNHFSSIISQGKVDYIFKSKPEDLRYIIEGPAGISKYKKQKELSNKKLNNIDNNLLRISDIIYELKIEDRDLFKQKQETQRYLILKKQYNEFNLRKLILKLNSYKGKKELILPKINNLQSRYDDISYKIKECQNKNKVQQCHLNDISYTQNQSHDELLNTSNQLEKLKGNKKLNNQNLSFKKEKLNSINNMQYNLQRHNYRLKDKKENLNKIIDYYRNSVVKLQYKIDKNDTRKIRFKINETNKILRNLQNKYVNSMQQFSNLSNKINNKNKEQSQFNIKLHQKNIELKNYIEQYNRIKSKLININKLIKKINYTKYNNLLNQNSNDINNYSLLLSRRQSFYNKVWHSLQLSKIKYNNLIASLKSHSNFYYGNRNLLSNNKLYGILGAVSEFIQVPSKYLKSIETALGNKVQQIIVDNNKNARAAIEYLNLNKLGRATLLPINNITSRFIDKRTKELCMNMSGYIDTADKLISIPNKLIVIKKHLLGNVIIVDNLKHAITISNSINHKYKIITLNGEMINAGGSITGGKINNAKIGILSQKQSIYYISNDLNRYRQELNNCLNNINKVKQSLKEVNNQYNKNKIKSSKSVQQKSFYNEKLKYYYHIQLKNKRVIKAIKLSIRNLRKDHKQFKDSKNEDKLKENEKLIQKNRNLIESKRKVIQEYQKLINNNDTKIQKFNQNLVIYKTKLDNYINKRESILYSIKNNNKILHNNKNTIYDVKQDINKINNKILNKQNIFKIKLHVEEIKKQINNNVILINNYKDSISYLDNIIQKKQEKSLSIYRKLSKLKNKVNDINANISEYNGKLKNKYSEKNINNIKDNSLYSMHDITKHINLIINKINKLNSVNINSIDKYKNVHNRYTFLVKQLNDLKISKNQLVKTMNNIDQLVKIKFKSTFNLINKYFKKIFIDIFKGGKAELSLTNPNNLLTTGIDIKAQPPGKRYSKMSLLSGGEQSLIAIILLFAILKVKPVPFCILDEIDSALDSENINRFARYMTKLKCNSQFILITHRKETMMYADNLYGITMQEPGISKILSINLKKG